MKNIVFALFLSLSLAACSNKDTRLSATEEIVKYIPGQNNDLLHSEIISSIEIIPLQTDSNILLGGALQLKVSGDEFYIVDHIPSVQIFRFDKTGVFLNAIGQRGRGPNEYDGISNFTVDDDGSVLIFSDGNESAYRYSASGEFVEKINIGYRFLNALQLEDGTFLLYCGFNSAYGDWRVAHIDRNGQMLGQGLDEKYNVLMMDERTLPVLSEYNDTVYLREFITPRNIIYQIIGADIRGKYSFDFGKYNVPDEYFQKNSAMEAAEYLFSRDYAIMRKYMENEHFVIIEAQIEKAEPESERPMVYGVMNKKLGEWKWFDIANESDIMFGAIQCLTGNKLICLVQPSELINLKDKSIIANSEIISEMDEYMNPVVLICTLE